MGAVLESAQKTLVRNHPGSAEPSDRPYWFRNAGGGRSGTEGKTQMEDDENDPASAERARLSAVAAEWLQTIPADVLAAAARGDVDLNDGARAELVSRGLDWAGRWIGFDAAARRLTEWTRQQMAGGADADRGRDPGAAAAARGAGQRLG